MTFQPALVAYRARESIMHMVWEMTNWLEKYVKKAKPAE